jgi:hypothetical protein
MPSPVVARSRARACGLAGIAASDPARGMDYQVEASKSDWSLVQRSPTECGVCACDHGASKMRKLWIPTGCCATKIKYMYPKYIHKQCVEMVYTYIYRISTTCMWMWAISLSKKCTWEWVVNVSTECIWRYLQHICEVCMKVCRRHGYTLWVKYQAYSFVQNK